MDIKSIRNDVETLKKIVKGLYATEDTIDSLFKYRPNLAAEEVQCIFLQASARNYMEALESLTQSLDLKLEFIEKTLIFQPKPLTVDDESEIMSSYGMMNFDLEKE